MVSSYSRKKFFLKSLSRTHFTTFKQLHQEGNGTPLQYSCLENPMAWWATVHDVAKTPTQLRDSTFTFHFHALEKEMATHSSILALENPRDGGAWWPAVYGVAQSQTRLNRLSSSSSHKAISRCTFMLYSNLTKRIDSCGRLSSEPQIGSSSLRGG